MIEILFQIKLRRYGANVYAYIPKEVEEEISAGDYVILSNEGQMDYGIVISTFFLEEDELPPYKIDRKATEDDLLTIKSLADEIPKVLKITMDKVGYHNLDMKLISADYTFDKSKLIVYFVAEERVDFRQLVKDLARTFKTRIEMRQIGVRDGARMLGGIGICGNEVCCSRFLREFKSMSIKMAKDQGIALNPGKMSGMCGRLMCCLGYEWQTYRDMRKGLPREGQTVNTPEGKGRVLELNILKRTAVVEVGKDEYRRIIVVDYNHTSGGPHKKGDKS